MFDGQIAQSVEQRTENPRVGGSIPSLATTSNLVTVLGSIRQLICHFVIGLILEVHRVYNHKRW